MHLLYNGPKKCLTCYRKYQGSKNFNTKWRTKFVYQLYTFVLQITRWKCSHLSHSLLKFFIFIVLLSIKLDDTLCYSRKINVKRNNHHRTHVYSNLQSSEREHPFRNYTFKRRNSNITSFSRNFPKNIIFSPEYYYSGKKRKSLTVNGTKRDILLLPQVETGILTGQPTQVLQNQLYQNSYRFAPQSALNLIGSRRQSEYVDDGYASKSQDESYALPADDRMYGDDRSDADSSYLLPQSSAQIGN